MNPLQVLFDYTLSFYSTMNNLWEWFSKPISIIGLPTFTPFDIIFSWGTLALIILAVLIKKVVPAA